MLPPIVLNWGVGLAAITIISGIALGLGAGVWLGRELNRRFPPMLAFHAREHKRLREVAQQIRENLRRLTGLKSTYSELDSALKHDVQLRVQASELRMQLDAKAREMESFHASEGALRELEGASAAIAAQLDALHTETIRLRAQPHSAAQRINALFELLRQ